MPLLKEDISPSSVTKEDGGCCAVSTPGRSVHDFEHLLKFNQLSNQAFILSGVGHMFNNPINTILLSSRLFGNFTRDINDLFDGLICEPDQAPAGFRDAGLTVLGDMPQVIRCINESANKLSQLVSQLSGFADKDALAGNNDVDINQLISHSASLLHHKIYRYTNSFTLDLECDLPVLSGNAQQMSQVLLILLMNSLFSLPDRSCKVVVSTSCDHVAGYVQICVRDNGSGILPEILPHVFEPFFSTWQEHGCIGIGLTVADLVIRNHGGDLLIDSEPGKGTAVIVSLPLQNDVNSFKQESYNA